MRCTIRDDFNMADINKTALLILNPDKTKFLAVKKATGTMKEWIMPGGKIELNESLEDSLVREIQEELNCDVDKNSIEFIHEYEAPAAGQPGKILNLKLYFGNYTGILTPSREIGELGWLGKDDQENIEASETIRLHIIPDLIRREILK